MSLQNQNEHAVAEIPVDLQHHAMLHCESRRDIEWLRRFSCFREMWAQRHSDLVPRGHPMEHWVWKQRAAHKKGTMQVWRADLLAGIGFPLEALKVEHGEPMTDVTYALKLIDFWHQHDHYAPTITIGGAGLTRWVRLMRDSCGLSGLFSGTPQSVAEANRLLFNSIDGFDWRNTHKSDINLGSGLSFNGFAPSNYKRPGTRGRQLIDLAKASFAFTDRMASMRALWDFAVANEDVGTAQFVRRINGFEQPVSVTVMQASSPWSPPEVVWWLHSVDFNAHSGEMTLLLHGGDDFRDEAYIKVMGPSLHSAYDVIGEGAYSASFRSTGGQYVVHLSYDYILADSTHRTVPGAFRSTSSPDFCFRQMDWPTLLLTDRMPFVVPSIEDTAYRAFSVNISRLERLQNERQASSDQDCLHIGWGKHREMFKFIEHQVKKANEGKIPFSHGDRLSLVNFTWGARRINGSDIARRAYRPYGRIH